MLRQLMGSVDDDVIFCCRGSTKNEDAAELYVKAGNNFKMAKKWAGKICPGAMNGRTDVCSFVCSWVGDVVLIMTIFELFLWFSVDFLIDKIIRSTN